MLLFLNSYAPVDIFYFEYPRKGNRITICSNGLEKLKSFKSNWLCPLKKQKKKLKMDARKICTEDPYLNFPILTDLKSITHISQGKYMIVLRGLPGSGKSTIARNLQTIYPNNSLCSADDHFLVDGTYKFDISGLKDAHAACQNKAKLACQSDMPVVIIDNTNVRRWEMKYYFDLARHTNYTVIVVETKTPWKCDARELSKRNKHGVPEDILKEKVSHFDRLLPGYYGWFMTEKKSRDIMYVAKVLFHECLKKCPEYFKILAGNASSTRKDKETAEKHFNWLMVSDILHSTAKYCNKGRALGAIDYIDRKDVNDTIGTASDLQITGFTFSKDTVGARVQLSETQLNLFDKPEERERDEILSRNASVCARLAKVSLTGYANQKSCGTKSSQPRNNGTGNLTCLPDNQSDRVKSTIRPPCGFGRSAHITVSCAERVKPSQTIYDVLDICDLEQSQSKPEPIPVMGGQAVDLGDGFCAVYLYRPITVSCLFSAFYF